MDELSQTEVALGLPIPIQFREFLLRNGGVPKGRFVDYVDDDGETVVVRIDIEGEMGQFSGYSCDIAAS